MENLQILREHVRARLGNDTTEKYIYNNTVCQVREEIARSVSARFFPSGEELKQHLAKRYRVIAYEYFSMPPEKAKEMAKRDYQNKTTGFHSFAFVDLQTKQTEEDAFITQPIEIEEGVEQCGKCKSWKTSSFELQLRSGDEGMTTFVQCHGCKNKWKM